MMIIKLLKMVQASSKSAESDNRLNLESMVGGIARETLIKVHKRMRLS